jgi:hydrogenase-4 membrane subunit HyfE
MKGKDMTDESSYFYALAKNCSMEFVKENASRVYFVCVMSILAFVLLAIGCFLHSIDWIALGFMVFVGEFLVCFMIISDMKRVTKHIKKADDIHFEEVLKKIREEKKKTDNSH